MDKLDILSREKFVEQLVTIIEKITDNKKSTSFAIDGIWGCGKSFVLDMVEGALGEIQSEETNSDKYFIIRYNCWEYDYYQEPLVAIVATMLDTIEEKTQILYGETGEKIKGVLKAAGATLLSIVNGAVKSKTGVDLGEAYKIVSTGLAKGKETYANANDYDVYFSFKKALNSLHEVLNELSKQYTVVFVIDELDRCLPAYAIKVLERLHHLIEDTKNVINIIAIDKIQLKKSISHIFGFDNTEEYLKKFIQFTISLNLGTVSEKITDKYSDYIRLFDKNLIEYDDSVEEFMQNIFKKIDVREQERLINRAMVVHKILFPEIKDYSFMCMEMLIILTTSCYENTIYIGESMKNFNGLVENRKKEPPFKSFLDEKFRTMSTNGRMVTGNLNNSSLCVVNTSNSLYVAIFIMWYELFLNNKNVRGKIEITDAHLKDKLYKDVEELKEFLKLVRIVK